MKKHLLFSLFLLSGFICKGTIHVISNSGFTFTPMMTTILAGDTVDFQIDPSHNAVEVSQSTYISNMNTALPGGFSVGFGGGMVFTAGWTQGTHYYVCQPHASFQMKGTIEVQGTVGIGESYAMPGIVTAPNPFTSSMTVHAPGMDSFDIYAISGAWVMSVALDQANAPYTLHSEALAPGMYFLRFRRDDAVAETRRVIKY